MADPGNGFRLPVVPEASTKDHAPDESVDVETDMAMTDDERAKVWNEAVRECARVAAGHAEGFDFQKALAECRDTDYGTASGRLAASKDVLTLLTTPGASRPAEASDDAVTVDLFERAKVVIDRSGLRYCAATTWENERVQIQIRSGSFEDQTSAIDFAVLAKTLTVGDDGLLAIALEDGSVTSVPHSDVFGCWKEPVHEELMKSQDVVRIVSTEALTCIRRDHESFLDPIPLVRRRRTAA